MEERLAGGLPAANFGREKRDGGWDVVSPPKSLLIWQCLRFHTIDRTPQRDLRLEGETTGFVGKPHSSYACGLDSPIPARTLQLPGRRQCSDMLATGGRASIRAAPAKDRGRHTLQPSIRSVITAGFILVMTTIVVVSIITIFLFIINETTDNCHLLRYSASTRQVQSCCPNAVVFCALYLCS